MSKVMQMKTVRQLVKEHFEAEMKDQENSIKLLQQAIENIKAVPEETPCRDYILEHRRQRLQARLAIIEKCKGILLDLEA